MKVSIAQYSEIFVIINYMIFISMTYNYDKNIHVNLTKT